jgi:multiple sugar transport system ATP-binding protein
LKQLHQKLGITTIYVTHDQVEAMTLADKIVVLNQGRIQQIGDPQSIYARPANRMVATFLGSPPMNILPAKFKNNAFDVGGQLLAIPANIREEFKPQQGQGFDLGIRPEHIYLNDELRTPSAKQATRSVSNTRREGHEEGELEVEVKVVEPLGRETLIRAGLPGFSEVLVNVQAGADVRLRFRRSHNFRIRYESVVCV